MKKLILLLSFAVSVAAFGQNITDAQGSKQGKWKKLYPNGEVMYEGTFKDDKPVGEMLRYDESGKLRSIQQYAEGSDNFTVEYYDPQTGKLTSKGAYNGKLRDGEWQYIAPESGTVVMIEHLKNGKLSGTTQIFNLDKGLIEEMNWVDDVMVGAHKRYFDDGTLYIEQQYDTGGALTGEVKMYFENGALAAKGNYTAGKKEGKFEFFNPDGTPDFSFIARDNVLPQTSIDVRQQTVLQDFLQQIEGVGN